MEGNKRSRPIRILKIDLAREVVESAVKLTTSLGKEERHPGVPGPTLRYDAQAISITYQTPRTLNFITNEPFGIDIWYGEGRHHKKVFSAYWNEIATPKMRVLNLIRFDHGPWLPILHALAKEIE
jgi:hypothetical protein